jgi:hypothetical protein
VVIRQGQMVETAWTQSAGGKGTKIIQECKTCTKVVAPYPVGGSSWWACRRASPPARRSIRRGSPTRWTSSRRRSRSWAPGSGPAGYRTALGSARRL